MNARIYVSTGGAREQTAVSWAHAFLGISDFPLELSGGSYSANVRDEIRDLTANSAVMLHNYFPPPKEAFVLNLASVNPDIAERSLNLVRQALELSGDIRASHYAVHAGYCLDPEVSSLGRPLQGDVSGTREQSLSRLIDSLRLLSEYAREVGVRLMVENHVLTRVNSQRFDENPLLMTDPDEIELVIGELAGNVSLLLDVGHLKVSSQTLGFSLCGAMDRLLPLTEGFHLSENGGETDDHQSFSADAWFMPFLAGRGDFMTVEVHSPKYEDSVSAALATRDFLASDIVDG